MDAIDQPWPGHQLLTPAQVAEYLGVTTSWVKRARNQRTLEFIKVRGSIRMRARVLYAYVEANTEPAKPKPITRIRTPEHNAKIGAAVRRARARKGA
jgi:excisionase family DNA binding protein